VGRPGGPQIMSGRRDNLRIALVRAVPAAGDLAANWATFERLARRAAGRGAELCMSPECFLDGYAVAHAGWTRRRLLAAGREASREYLPRLRRLACELHVALLLGTTYTRGRRCTNAAFLVGPDGRHLGRYDKTHLLRHDLAFDPGRRLEAFETAWGPVGVMICADRRWPEVPRVLRVRGARVILNPTYGMRHLANEWWMRTRSYENQCWVCFCHPTVSLVTNPRGDIHAKRTGRAGLLVTDLDLSAVGSTMLAARRPELYGALTRRGPARRPGDMDSS